MVMILAGASDGSDESDWSDRSDDFIVPALLVPALPGWGWFTTGIVAPVDFVDDVDR